MSTSKHTPGPWIISDKWEICTRSQHEDQSWGMLIPHGDVFGDDREANARLIAAAPELLQAAKAALGHLTGYGETSTARINLREAIAKAEGRS